jgi:hypothetical protein
MKLIAPVLLALTILFNSCSQDNASLKIQMKLGDVYELEMKTLNEMDQTSMGTRMKMNTEMIQYGNIEVKEVTSDDKFKFQLIYNRIVQQVEMAAPTETSYTIDTDQPDSVLSEEAFESYKSMSLMLKKPFDVTMNKRGEVLTCASSEYEAGLKKLADENPIMKMAIDQLSIETQKAGIQSLFVILPEGKTTAGSEWTYKSDAFSSSYPVVMESNYKVIKSDENITTLTSKGTVSINKNAKGMMAMMVKMMDLTGEVNSEIKLDSKTGLPIQNKIITQMKGSMKMFGANIPLSVKTTQDISIKKKVN